MNDLTAGIPVADQPNEPADIVPVDSCWILHAKHDPNVRCHRITLKRSDDPREVFGRLDDFDFAMDRESYHRKIEQLKEEWVSKYAKPA